MNDRVVMELRRTSVGFELWYPTGKGMSPLLDGSGGATLFLKREVYELAYHKDDSALARVIRNVARDVQVDVRIRQ